jgi:hypothetical protein
VDRRQPFEQFIRSFSSFWSIASRSSISARSVWATGCRPSGFRSSAGPAQRLFCLPVVTVRIQVKWRHQVKWRP